MEFRILGPLEIYDGAEKLVVGPPRIRTVLAVLLATPGRLVSMDRLVDELWPEAPPPDARALIHSYISRLRRALGDGPSGQATTRRLATRKPGYVLTVGEEELDLHRYQRQVADARAAPPRDRVALLRAADQLWRGTPFADVPATPTVTAAITRLRHGWLALAATADDQLAHWFGIDPEPTPAWPPPRDTVAAVAADPMRWFDEEHHGLMAAIRWDADAVTWALAQRMTSYLERRGHYDDWIAVLRTGLAAADDIRDRQGQATMLGLLLDAEAARDEYDSALRYAILALAAYQAVATSAPPLSQAPSVSSPALDDARRLGDALAVGLEACRLAQEMRLEGARIDYLALFEEARDAFRVGGVPQEELWTLKNVFLVYVRQHRFTEAEGSLRRGQVIVQNGAGLFKAGGDLAAVAAAYGRTDLAERLATAAIEVANRTHDAWTTARALHTLADIRASRGDFDGSARTYRKALHAWTELRNPLRVAMIEEAMAQLE